MRFPILLDDHFHFYGRKVLKLIDGNHNVLLKQTVVTSPSLDYNAWTYVEITTRNNEVIFLTVLKYVQNQFKEVEYVK